MIKATLISLSLIMGCVLLAFAENISRDSKISESPWVEASPSLPKTTTIPWVEPSAELAITMPEVETVLVIRRPYLSINGAVVVRVTDEEWAKLVAAYPKELRNADSSHDLTFMAAVRK